MLIALVVVSIVLGLVWRARNGRITHPGVSGTTSENRILIPDGPAFGSRVTLLQFRRVSDSSSPRSESCCTLPQCPYARVSFAGLAVIAAFLNAVFDNCLGCQLYVLLVRAGLIGRHRTAP